MKYTFEDSQEVAFFCKVCYNVTTLKFATLITGDTEKSVVPKYIKLHGDNTTVMCGRCGHHMAGIDIGVIEYVKEFNMRGYRTMYSCSGHIKKKSPTVTPADVSYKVGDNFSHYPYMTKQQLFEFAQTPIDEKSVAVKDMKGLPQTLLYLEEPNFVWHPRMDVQKKVELWNAIKLAMLGDASDESLEIYHSEKYPDFYATCKASLKNGAEINELCAPDQEHARIAISTQRTPRTICNVPASAIQEIEYNDVILSFAHLLDDIILNLPKEDTQA